MIFHRWKRRKKIPLNFPSRKSGMFIKSSKYFQLSTAVINFSIIYFSFALTIIRLFFLHLSIDIKLTTHLTERKLKGPSSLRSTRSLLKSHLFSMTISYVQSKRWTTTDRERVRREASEQLYIKWKYRRTNTFNRREGKSAFRNHF